MQNYAKIGKIRRRNYKYIQLFSLLSFVYYHPPQVFVITIFTTGFEAKFIGNPKFHLNREFFVVEIFAKYFNKMHKHIQFNESWRSF